MRASLCFYPSLRSSIVNKRVLASLFISCHLMHHTSYSLIAEKLGQLSTTRASTSEKEMFNSEPEASSGLRYGSDGAPHVSASSIQQTSSDDEGIEKSKSEEGEDSNSLSKPLMQNEDEGEVADADEISFLLPRDSGLYESVQDGVRPTDHRLHLYHFEQIPERLKDNPFIVHKYRANYTLLMCIRSVFALHNESMNIWTHLFGFFGFLGLCLYLLTVVANRNTEVIHIFTLVAFSIGLLACMGCSTCFHMMNAHYSGEVCKIMHKLDYFGITCLITGSFIPTICLAFACDPVWKWVYLTMVLVMGAFGLIGPWFHFWTEIKYRTFRLFVYTVLVGSGVFPIIHVNFILPVSNTAPYVEGLAIEILLYLLGMLIYSFCLPERWFPGKFDIWLHSHQIWHVFVIAAAVVHFFTIAAMYINWNIMSKEC